MKLIFVATLSLVSLVIFVRSVKIQRITCITSGLDCPENISMQFKLLEGKNVFETKKEIDKILYDEFSVVDYSVNFDSLRSYKVDLTISKPVFALKAPDSNHFSLVDNVGRVLYIRENTNLDYLTLSNGIPNVGEFLSDEMHDLIYLSQGIRKLIPGAEIELIDNYLSVQSPTSPKILIPIESENQEVLLGSVNLIFSRLKQITQDSKISESDISYLDFRYKNPLIVKNEQI